MNASDFILDVNEADFEYEVIAHSQQVPVVVDFWAEWCGPCRTLGPMLEKLAEAAGGTFRLAKVNVDENPNLALRYNVRGIPAVKAFRQGQVVSEFVGAQPEPNVREFLRGIAPRPSDLALEKGQSLLGMHQWEGAEQAFQKVLGDQPDSPQVLLGLSKALLAQGKSKAALQLLTRFPASREYAAAEKLVPLAKALIEDQEAGKEFENPLDATYIRSLSLIRRGNLEAAMDGLLDVLRQDKTYREGIARKILIALFEILGDDHKIARQYRSEMASILF